MNIILLSGGSGKRLWPLSNDARSKQFIKMFKTENGKMESMVQRVYRQIKTTIPSATITIATGKKQISSIYNQLGNNLNACVEPDRRDTFPAIALACVYLKDILKVSINEPVLVCPIDPYVNSDFFESLKVLSDLVENNKTNLCLMGIEPTYPSEKYGYILPKDKNNISIASQFKEKPNIETAEKLIKYGALWNSGIFAFKLGYLIDKAHELLDFTDYHNLFSNFSNCPKISFDYAITEKETSILVTRFNGKWKDLGTWNTFCEEMGENVLGEGILNKSCTNTSIINELDIPILCMGLKNIVVAASAEGILISEKEQSSYIKPFVDEFEQQIMFAEKSWGTYNVLDVQDDSLTVKVVLNAGNNMNYHSHERRNEVWTVMKGTGLAVIDDMEYEVKTGDVLTISAGCKHTITAITKLHIIEVQLGKDISADDKQKYEL